MKTHAKIYKIDQVKIFAYCKKLNYPFKGEKGENSFVFIYINNYKSVSN